MEIIIDVGEQSSLNDIISLLNADESTRRQ